MNTTLDRAKVYDVATRSAGAFGLLDTACTELRILEAALTSGAVDPTAGEDVQHTLWRIEERIALVRDWIRDMPEPGTAGPPRGGGKVIDFADVLARNGGRS